MAGTAVRYAIEALEERTLLNSYIVTNPDNSGNGSFRDAIQQANANPGLDIINFNIALGGVQTIKPTFFLPQITDPVQIHGETEPGYAGKPLIELDGSVAGTTNGLEFKVGGNLVEGLDVHSFALDGIVFAEPAGSGATGNNTVLKNFIGTDPAGTAAMGNQSGIHLIHSPHDLIENNLISGNAQSGIFVADQFSTDTHIAGNLIGTDISGMTALGNQVNGVALGAPPSPSPGDGFASGNIVGSNDPALRNVISGNGQSGIWIKGGDRNTIEGNYIGVAVDGKTPLGNGTRGASADPRFGLDGILIDGATNTVIGGADAHTGNIISANDQDGIEIVSGATGNSVLGNFVGTAANGLAALPNARDGVAIFDSAGNSVGGVSAGSRNILSGNKADGVFLGVGASGSGAVANVVLGNTIGLDVTGLTTLPNQGYGVEISGGTNNIIGGTMPGAQNVISGNLSSGVVIGGSAPGNQVLGDFIGTDITGLLARANRLDGIDVFSSSLNVIGGTTAAARNIISGNASDGIVIGDSNAVGNIVEGNYIGTDVTGIVALGNLRDGLFITALISATGAVGTVVGGAVPGARNVISGNGNDGIQISSGATANSVLGNLIGTNSTGAVALPNGRHGVAIFDASGNTIGAAGTASTSRPAGNVISGNKGSGVLISGASTGTATANTVLGNFIGLDTTGMIAVPNVQDGVLIQSAAGNVIGGTTADARNVISGNGSAGVVISGAGAKGNAVEADYIGTDATGVNALPNALAGVFINDVPSNSIGGGGAGSRNVISGNNGPGLYITGNDASNNDVFGNFIGTNSMGALPLGNTGDGVLIENAPTNLVGGIENGQGNVISGNDGDGVALTGLTAKGNKIEHNYVGTDLGAVIHLGNQRYGVEALNGANNNTIGGPDPLYGNTVAFNGASLGVKGHGVVVPAGAANSIRENSIFQNAGRGIDLVNLASPDTFTINDAQTAANPNDPVQDAPVVTAVATSGANTIITWTLNSIPSTTFTIDFFSNEAPNPSGFGDGTTFLISRTVTTDADGNVSFDLTTPSTNKFISATATSPVNDTSEFSMVDTDADGLADAWETRGIDFDEDGKVDLTLPGANPNHKDIYVEVDAMQSVVPKPGALQIVIDAFAAAPVVNPDGTTGITLHAALNEVIPDQSWFGDRNGNNKDALGEDRNANGIIDPGEDVNGNGVLDYGDPADQDPFVWFNDIKQSGVNGLGGFGDSDEQRSNSSTMDAKRLTYRYALFALGFATNRPIGGPTHGVGGTQIGTSGIAEIGGNDLIVTLNYGWAGTAQQQAGTFMHELGHTLGLRHGGADDINTKPNYNSVMNYLWQTPQDWMNEDTNGNGIQDFNDLNGNGVKDPGEPFTEFDINGNGHFGDTEVWSANYSDTVINTLDENNLIETNGIGGTAGRWEPVGPDGHLVLETGPVDWSQSDADHDGVKNNDTITAGIDINRDDFAASKLAGFEDWSHIQYYFGDSPDAADGAPEPVDPDGGEMTAEQWQALNAQGDGPGVLEFVQSATTVSEGVGEVTIIVIRGGGTQGAVSVDYSTADGTATEGPDYRFASGTLTFADGEYAKTFTVQIIDDFVAERTESILLNLSNATGGALLRPNSTATLNILDNDDNRHFFVTNTNDSGPGSLRQAILGSNSQFGEALIDFNITGSGVHTIAPLSSLPTILFPVDIDGTTQPGFAGKPIIQISGQSAPGNGLVVNASDTTIRGLVINGFSGVGISDTGILGGAVSNIPPVDDDVIAGNYIGTDVTGLLPRPNFVGIALGGLGGSDFQIGGTSPADRNVISGNLNNGINIIGGNGFNIEGNYIGIGADGVTPLGNGNDGIRVSPGAYLGQETQGLVVGGLDAAAGNVIAYNTLYGIDSGVFAEHQFFFDGHAFLSNSIHDNGILGINFNSGFVTLNDSGLTDGSYSDPQNYPILGSAISSGDQTTIAGYLNSRANSTFLIQFFSNPKVLLSGFGQGQTFLGSTSVTTDANGHADFTATFNVAVPNRNLITATATDSLNETSEFSPRLSVGDVLGNVYIVNTTDDLDHGFADSTHTSLREAIFAADNHPGPDTILFDIPGGGVQTIAPLTPLPQITDAVTIDGTSQPGFAGTPLIQIVGTSMELVHLATATTPASPPSASASGYYLSGLVVLADNSTIRGLDINSFFQLRTTSIQGGGMPLTVYGNNNVIEGNFIGTDVTGTLARQNLQGIVVSGQGNRIGGTAPAQRNIISGNFGTGLTVSLAGTTNATGTPNLIEGNFIGTDVTGTKALGNGSGASSSGVTINYNNILGGSAPGAGNVISANLGTGVLLNFAAGSVIQGNFIGTDVTGTKMLGNTAGGDGIQLNENVFPAPTLGTTIGGTLPGQRNIISNNRVGIFIVSGFADVIQGNYIGTDITGTLDFGNSVDGIDVGGDKHIIGGTAPGAGNLISGNNRFGILLLPSINGSGNVVQGNRIGTQADGVSPLANSSDGIAVAASFSATTSGTGPTNDLIGGTSSGAGNIIAFNGGRGVNILAGQQIAVLSNSIYSNASLGIDLNGDGVTANDPKDVDAGDNNLQNFPVLATVVTDGARTTVTGSFIGTPSTVFMLQFFASSAADPSGFGEGQTLLGTRQIITDAAGNATFTMNFAVSVPTGQFISATATDPLNNTSEFSSNLQLVNGTVAPNQPPNATISGTYTINEGDPLTLDASLSADPDGDPLTISWDLNGDGVFGDATGAKPSLAWAQLQALGIIDGPSSFNVKVRVDDGQGHVVTSPATTLTVLNVAPTASVGPEVFVTENDPVTLTGTFTDPGTADTYTFNWHVIVNNGQHIPDGTSQNFSFVPPDNGNYVVTFTVTDDDGASSSATLIVYVANADPIATILGAPAQSAIGVPISVTSSVTDVSPVDTAAGFVYSWDAALVGNNSVVFFGSSPNFSFTPTLPGTYFVFLSARDKDGGSAFVNTKIIVPFVVTSASFTPGGSGNERITIAFDHGAPPPILSLADFTVQDAKTGQVIDPTTMSLAFDVASETAVITFPGLTDSHLQDDRYTLTIPGANYTFNFFRLTGDATQNATVGFSDLVILAQNYDKTGPQLSWSDGDFNGDGNVDFADLVALAQNYGRSLDPLPAAATIARPIPATVIGQSVNKEPTTAPAPAIPVTSVLVGAVSSKPPHLALEAPKPFSPLQQAAPSAVKPAAARRITDRPVAAEAQSAVKNRLGRFSTARLFMSRGAQTRFFHTLDETGKCSPRSSCDDELKTRTARIARPSVHRK